MSTLSLCIRLKTLVNKNNNSNGFFPLQKEFAKFFVDLKEAFDDNTKPIHLIKVADNTDVPAIALCYALYKENLTPFEVSYNASHMETIINVTADTIMDVEMNDISQRIKKEVARLTLTYQSDLSLVKDFDLEIKQCIVNESSTKADLDAQSSSSGVSTQHDEPCYQLAAELDLNNKNRLFLACKNCYASKPPIVIHRHKDSQECGWCKNIDTILLHEETYTVEDDESVEYSVVRKYDDECEVEDCKNYFSATSSCIKGDSCRYAHSPDEKKLWDFVKGNSQSWDELTSSISQCFQKVETTNGVFHCAICRENFNSGQDFSHHCDGLQHKQMSRCVDGKLKWKYRLPPNLKGENYYLCHQFEMDKECPNGNICRRAHSPEELDEWYKRVKILKNKRRFAQENKLLSFPEQISQEFDKERSSVSVLTEVKQGVKITVTPNVGCFHRCPTNGTMKWTIKLNCSDTQDKLNHVALLKRDGNDFYKFCKLRRRKEGYFTSHLDYTTTDDSNNLLRGQANFKVKFCADKPGTFSDILVFEFRKCPQPALMVKFQVFVGDKISFLPERPKPSQQVSWENRPIVPFAAENQNEFEGIMKELIIKYKAPEIALEYKEDGKDLDSKSLTAKNYVDEMHRFLYREEAARKKAISNVHCSCHIGLSENYFSMNRGLCFTDGKGGIFGIFQLPGNLTRDTDEGLLILENCQMVFLANNNSDDRSTVYEAKIETKAADHVVLNIPKSCVDVWNLQTGQVIQCDVQFQLDRRLFCMSHSALDQLPELGRLSMVCPEPRARHNYTVPVRRNGVKSYASLDSHQNRVLDHLTSDNVSHPLFAVVGPFGTGKTYTISQCVLYLLENDPQAKILICTHSNTAADLYIQNNFTADEWEGKVIRVYYHDRSLKSVPLEVHRFCLKNKARTQFRYPNTKEILSDKVKIVITTFTTSLALGRLATGLTGAFTHIFLDEAAQAMECEAIIPLTLASTNNTKVIVAGDHMQISQKMYSKKFGSKSDYTLVERMYTRYETFPPKFHDDLYVFLKNNYRCVEPILDLIQVVFYKKGLLTCCTNEQCMPGVPPVQFFHTKGKCIQDRESGGFYNEEEAYRSVMVVQNLLEFSKGGLKQEDIVVVASHAIQVKYIRKLMRNYGKGHVKVDRVRNVQGFEFKVVIMSCVHSRTSPQDKTGSKSGLLSDVGLLNTAITRSKVAVIAIGDAITLCAVGNCHKKWDQFIEKCHETGSLQFNTYENIKAEISKISRLNPESKISTLNPEAKCFDQGGKVSPRKSPRLKPPPSPSSSSSSQNIGFNKTDEEASGDSDDAEEEEEDDKDGDEGDQYENEDALATVDDKILDDILEKQLGYRTENIVVKVDKSGLEHLEAMDDPNEATHEQDWEGRGKIIHPNFTLEELHDMLRSQPDLYKACYLNMITWFSAEATLKKPEKELSRIDVESKQNLGRAFDKDEVVVKLNNKVEEKPLTGKVIGVLSRYKEPRSKEFICVPDQDNPRFMRPVDNKATKFAIHASRDAPENNVCLYRFENVKTKSKSKTTVTGEKLKFLRFVPADPDSYTVGKGKLFIVRYLKWSEYCPYPLGFVSKVISAVDAEQYFAIAYDRPKEHTKNAEKESEALTDVNASIRKDCTNLYAFTIDPPGAMDLDDALSIEKCSQHTNCYEIGVHIADVASVVPFNSKIDKEARKRSTTFYDQTVKKDKSSSSPMLPRSLSSNKCSLLPQKTRPTISTFFHTSKPLDVSQPGFDVPRPQLTKIRSRRQMNYKEAEDLLREARSNPQEDLSEISDNTLSQQLYQIWLYLLELRFSRLGTSAFHHQPNSNKLDEFFDEASAHMLIEEAMITLNACTAIFLRKKRRNFLLRCQDPPPEDEWRDWMSRYSSQIRISLHLTSYANHSSHVMAGELDDIPEQQTTSDKDMYVIPEVMKNIKLALERGDLESAIIYLSSDRLQPSISPANNRFIGIQKSARLKTSSSVGDHPASSHSHFQLRLPFYSWCSSPIRRYPDIIAQREIIKICKKPNVVNEDGVVILDSRMEEPDMEEICKKVAMRQNDAKEYEAGLMRYNLGKLFQDQQERFYQQVVVTEVTNREIRFCFVNRKGFGKSTTNHLSYPSLMTKESTAKLAENVKPRRAEEKILEENKLVWHIRYYKLNDRKNKQMFRHSHFDHVVVSSQPVRELVNVISDSISSRFMFGEEISTRIKEHFNKIYKEQKKSPKCPANTMLGHMGPCDGKKCDVQESLCSDHMSFRTKNNIRHVRVISMVVEAGFPLLVQLNPKIDRGLLEPTVQLLCLAEDLDVCLTHQSDAVGTFAYDVKPRTVWGEYRTLEAYAYDWLPVLRLDGVYNAVEEAMSITYDGVTIKWGQPGVTGTFELSMNYCEERLAKIYRDGFLCIRIKNRPSNAEGLYFTWVAHALITSVKEDEEKDKILVEFEVRKNLISNATKRGSVPTMGTTCTVEHIQLQVPYKRMAAILQQVKRGDDDQDFDIAGMLCLGKAPATSMYDETIKKVKSVFDSIGKEVKGFDFPLNEVQARVVREAMRNQLYLIQGPPGTGKSLTGSYLAFYFRKLNIATDRSDAFVLYCGPSNKSVDVVAEYLKKTGLRILRVYGKMMEELDYPNPLKPKVGKRNQQIPSKNLESITLHKIIREKSNTYHQTIREFDKKFNEEKSIVTLKEYKAYESVLADAKEEELARHDVIICTCTAAAMKLFRDNKKSKHPRLHKVTFSHCIIDEAGMCSEPETLVPVVASKANQVVLIGDHQQLQPVILCDRARALGMGVSMFERLHRKAEMLTVQYRMHETICRFPSEHFYQRKLTTDESVTRRDKNNPGVLVFPPDGYNDNTAVFAHMDCEEDISYNKFEHGGINSKYNTGQARAVVKILVWLHLTKGVPLKDIMILSPYEAQRNEIAKIIEKERSQLCDVHVGTVVTSQGSERDYVIVSTVRSPSSEVLSDTPTLSWQRKNLGFITDRHQVNVAITRAKCGLCVIGNKNLLEKDSQTWEHLLKSYQERGSIVDFHSEKAPWNNF